MEGHDGPGAREWAELLRLRDRTDALANTLRDLEWSVTDLREWRAEVRVELQTILANLGGLLTKDEIAEAVAEKMSETRALRLTNLQKVVASVLGLVTLAAGIKGLIY